MKRKNKRQEEKEMLVACILKGANVKQVNIIAGDNVHIAYNESRR